MSEHYFQMNGVAMNDQIKAILNRNGRFNTAFQSRTSCFYTF